MSFKQEVFAEVTNRPNIVIIMADDLGWGSLNCYGAPTQYVKTPNLDRLAAEGRRFTDANTAASVCSPSRYALLTGQYAWRSSLKYKTVETLEPMILSAGQFTIASMLKEQGYETAAFGKWHLGFGTAKRVDYRETLKPGPRDIGFNYFFGIPQNHGDITGVYVENEGVYGLKSKAVVPAGVSTYGRDFLGIDAPQRVDENVMSEISNRTVEWINKQTPEKPFFVYYSPVSVHEPVTPSAENKGKSGSGPYGDFIQDLDDSVGKIVEAIDRKGIKDNTLILFTSDNGGTLRTTGKTVQAQAYIAGFHYNGELKDGKHNIFEGGFRVPYIIRYPGKIKPESVCKESINLVDTTATIAALLGISMPEPSKGAGDSFNVLPAWLDTPFEGSLRPAVVLHSCDGVFAIRQGPLKWIEGVPTDPQAPKSRQDSYKEQMYNLQEDPSESKNIISSNPEMAVEFKKLLQKYREQGYSRVN